jgi:hypothetical protein
MKLAIGRCVKTVCSGLGLAMVVAAMSGTAHAIPLPIPEIDPGSMGSAMTLLIGGAFLLAGKGRKS